MTGAGGPEALRQAILADYFAHQVPRGRSSAPPPQDAVEHVERGHAAGLLVRPDGRKAASLSTLGGVKYTSKREAQTKAAHARSPVPYSP